MSEPLDEKTEAAIEGAMVFMAHHMDCPAGDFVGGECNCGLDGTLNALRARIASISLTPEEARESLKWMNWESFDVPEGKHVLKSALAKLRKRAEEEGK